MTDRRIQSALISVFYKEGLEPVVRRLHALGIRLYSTGGTQSFITGLGLPSTAVEDVTGYPSILGGRVKTLHPKVFGGILARRGNEQDVAQLKEFDIPGFDLVIVDLYPFEETLQSGAGEEAIIEKIDIGGVSLIRAAAKNFRDVCIVASRDEYEDLMAVLEDGNGSLNLETRKAFAAAAFSVCADYDIQIADWFNDSLDEEDDDQDDEPEDGAAAQEEDGMRTLRYGENPHQQATFYGDLDEHFTQLNGKELSYNNLVDVDAACKLIAEFGGDNTLSGSETMGDAEEAAFAIIKHTNPCGVALRPTIEEAWEAALAGDKESAFGGVLITNQRVTAGVAERINEIFFEVLVAPEFEEAALALLRSKKNRILLEQVRPIELVPDYKYILGGNGLMQEADLGNFDKWEEAGARSTTPVERADLEFANIICKHLKSNAIALVKNGQLIGKGCGQTSRIDALRQALEKAAHSGFEAMGAVLASDAFFPFDDCIRLAHEAGIRAVIQPGGSVRDKDSIDFAKANDMALVMTGMRHFRH